MAAVVALVRADWRGRWRSWAGLVVLLAITLGAASSLIAGARRTDSAHQRFGLAFEPSTLLVSESSTFGSPPSLDLDVVAERPEVLESARASALLTLVQRPDGVVLSQSFGFTAFAPHDDKLGTSVNTWKVLEGRSPAHRAIDEAVIGFVASEQTGLGVGDHLRIQLPTTETLISGVVELLAGIPDRLAEGSAGTLDDLAGGIEGPIIDVEIVGIVATANSFPPLPGNVTDIVYLSPEVFDRFGDVIARQDFLFTRLRPGSDRAAFEADLSRLAGGAPASILASDDNDVNVRRSMHLQALALAALGALIGGAGLVVVSQGVWRHLVGFANVERILLSLGMPDRRVRQARMLTAACAAALTAPVALAVAITSSSLFPIGLAGKAEPDPGVHLDWLVLSACIIVPFVVFELAALAVRTERLSHPAHRRSSWFGVATRPLAASVGFRFAVDGIARRESGRFATGAVAVAVATASTVAIFGWSVADLRATPTAYGWSADIQIGTQGLPDLGPNVIDALARRPSVSGLASGTVVRLEIHGVRVDAFALEAAPRGDVPSVILDGRAVQSADELVLGAVTLDEVGAEIGDTVDVRLGEVAKPMRIVGRGVFPRIGDSGQLGRGARIDFSALDAFGFFAPHNIALVTFAPCCDESELVSGAIAPFPAGGPEPPSDLGGFGRADALPWLAAGFVTVFAVGVLISTVLLAARRHRRDLAVLGALGMSRRDADLALVVHVLTLTIIGAALGSVAGVAGGRLLWRSFASSIGVGIGPTVRLDWMFAGVAAMTLVAALVALAPAKTANRRGILQALRPE